MSCMQRMKVWTVLGAVTVVLWASISMVEPRSVSVDATMMEDEHKLITFDKIIFSTKTATRVNYMYFINELRNALLAHGGDVSGDIALLPPQTMRPTDPRRYLLVELTTGDQTVTLALDVANVYLLGYGAGTTATPFYFFSDVPVDVQTVLIPRSQDRRTLPYDSRYPSIERAAGLAEPRNRSDIPLGITHLDQHIRDMNRYIPAPSGNNRTRIARALLVCIQMVSEAARFRNIEQQIAQVAEPTPEGIYGELYPDDVMMGFEGKWKKLCTGVQTAATNGIFDTIVSVTDSLQFGTIESVRFLLAIVLVVCERRGANLHFLHMSLPPSIISSSSLTMRSTGLERDDEKCDKVLEPTSYITGRDGLCLEVNQGSYHNGNWIALSTCVRNRGYQLWTFRSDNTIRSGGKCLTTYGYAEGNYVMIYDCNTAVPDATKWKMQSDGSIRNPRSGLVLVATRDSQGVPWLVVGRNIYASKQAFYATNNPKPLVTTIVGHKGLCLLASGSRVWLEKCVSNDDEQKWNIYPDGTIRPQKNQKGCLKYGNAGGDSVSVETCDGWTEERWRFQNDGTILHVATDQVMDVKDTSAALPQITVNDYNHQRLSQIWFQVQP